MLTSRLRVNFLIALSLYVSIGNALDYSVT
jgi:hypothetical protein